MPKKSQALDDRDKHFDEAIGRRLRELRKAANPELTQADLAERLQQDETFADSALAHQTAISEFENGRRAIGLAHIEAFARALGVSPWELLEPLFEGFSEQAKAEAIQTTLEKWRDRYIAHLAAVHARFGLALQSLEAASALEWAAKAFAHMSSSELALERERFWLLATHRTELPEILEEHPTVQLLKKLPTANMQEGQDS